MLEELPGHVRILLRKLAKVPERDDVAPQARHRGDGRGSRVLRDQRELAEMLARAAPRDLGPVDAHRRLAFGDDEEADPAHRAFLDDGDAGAELALLHEACELPQLPLAEPREEPNALQLVDDR